MSVAELAVGEDAGRLAALIREAREAGITRRVLLVRLSELPSQLAQPHHLRLAREAVGPLAVADRARVFQLPNNDLVLVWRGAADAALRQTRAALHLLFEDEAGTLQDPENLCQVLALPDDAALLLASVEASTRTSEAPLRRAEPPRPLDLATLDAVEAALATADVARLVRRRAVCSPTEEGGMRLRWETRLLSLNELADSLAPGTDITADPWLFRRLTRVLDRRMLALLGAAEELRGAGPFGLGLNVASIVSPEFLRFDAGLPAGLRGQIVLGLTGVDMLADPAAFMFARDFARARQYRLMLRGVTVEQLGLLPLGRCRLDLLELHWAPGLLAMEPDALPFDPKRCVLAGVDDADALAWTMRHRPGFATGRRVVPDEWRRPGG